MPATIYIGTAKRFSQGESHVWKYDLAPVCPDRNYVCLAPPATTHQGDITFICQEQGDDGMWRVVYEGGVEDGQLEQRSPVFRTQSVVRGGEFVLRFAGGTRTKSCIF